MRRIAVVLAVPLVLAALTFVGGCGSSTEGFDSGDITITGHSAVLSGSTLSWSATLTSVSGDAADVKLQIKLKTPSSTTYFYTSPEHAEGLGAHETKTYSYTETGVSVPAGTTTYEYQVSFSALPS